MAKAARMPRKDTVLVTVTLTRAQREALRRAVAASPHTTQSKALRHLLQQFVEGQGVEWLDDLTPRGKYTGKGGRPPGDDD